MTRAQRSPPSIPVIDDLLAELAAAPAGGRAVFLQMGDRTATEATVSEFVRRARRTDRRLRIATASAADPRTPAWRQVALRLTGRHRAGAALRRSLGDWAAIIPLIGPVVSATLSTIAELTDRSPPATAALGTGSAIDDVRRILAHGIEEPRLIVLTNCEAADAAELSGAFALIREIGRTRTLLLVSAAAGSGTTASGFRDLMWEAERAGVGRRMLVDAPAPDDKRSELLRCAAGLGDTFEVAHLLHVLGRSEADIESDLQALVRAKVLLVRDTIERNGDLVDIYAFAPTAGQNRNGPDPTVRESR
ncbi:MAG TPA: hypothetical protein VHG09_10895 [Longimicrobiales bacterium]|nr:hypothetical protein [Longimicrobiales bacterium]